MILPMLASPTSSAGNRRPILFPDLMKSGDWIADVKLDGVRGLVQWDGTTARISNRNGVWITHRYPELVVVLNERLQGLPELVLDGEIVARDGRFETTLLRDQQETPRRIAIIAEQHPCMFTAFDLPEFRTPWHERRQKLVDLLPWADLAPHLAITPVSLNPAFLDSTREMGMEGVVAKHVNGRYEFGKRSKLWLKFRNRYRISCLVAGYTPGTGSRAHFGAMILALLGEDGVPVEVGPVGTGFTEKEIPALKEALDAGRLLVVEIETTNKTSAGRLRFPVFRGVRTDVEPHDCTLAQLEHLPTM